MLRALFVPAGFAHGFLTLEDESEVLYEMSDYFAPELARGIRWDDPALGIEMPGEVACINQRDAAYPDLDTGFTDGICRVRGVNIGSISHVSRRGTVSDLPQHHG